MHKARWLFVIALSLSTALVAAYALGAEKARAVEYGAEETRFLELINEYRQANGLGQLALSEPLSVASERHSEDMGTYGFFSHTTQESSYYPVGSTHAERIAQEGYDYNTYTAENIAYGQATAEEVFEAWRTSPDHDANMLGDYAVIGIGQVWVNGTPYWTTVFGAYADSSATGTTSGEKPATNDAQESPEPKEQAPEPEPQTAEKPQTVEKTKKVEQPASPKAVDPEAAEDQYSTGAAQPEQQARRPEPSGLTAPRAKAADTGRPDGNVRAENGDAGETAAAEQYADQAEAVSDETPEVGSDQTDQPPVVSRETAGSAPAEPAEETPTSEALPSEQITELPDTGGAPLSLLAGSLLVASGLLFRKLVP
jgi:uncharacterized protein YkwD